MVNRCLLVLASTCQAEEDMNFLTIGGKHQQRFTRRFGVAGTFEHGFVG